MVALGFDDFEDGKFQIILEKGRLKTPTLIYEKNAWVSKSLRLDATF